MLLPAGQMRDYRFPGRSLMDDSLLSVERRDGTRSGMRIEATQSFLPHRKTGGTRSAARERTTPLEFSSERAGAVRSPDLGPREAGRSFRASKQPLRGSE